MGDYLHKKYQIFFSDNIQEELIEYKIIDSPVSRIWLECVNYHLQSGNCTIYKNQSIKNVPNQKKIIELWNSIFTTIDNLNSIAKKKVIDIDKSKIKNNNSLLNYLHTRFHEIHDNLSDDCMQNYLEDLNKNIHILQDSQNSQFIYATFFLTSNKPQIKYNISDLNLYKYFNYENIEFGDLVLGYGTVGKNLYDSYKNNDIEVVKNGLIRPQKTIDSEVVLNFFNYDINSISSISSKISNLTKWVNHNNLQEFIDINLAQHRIVRQPLLGRLIGNYTFNDINEIFSLGKISRVNIV